MELSDHVIVFYNELITLMDDTGPLWQLIRKERYDQIKEVLIRIHGGEAVYILGKITLSATNGLHCTHW